ncbi:MAG TPA: alkaline phosphatase family protein, partial [Candidatus Nitrosotalea sp.]|nr:alkaline phosphatase family protein [Candidatus Nitrosotalea sp.]
GADGSTSGVTVPNSNCSPPIAGGPIALTKSNLVVPKDMNHSWHTGYTVAYDGGKLDAFDNIHFNGGAGPPECYAPYQYTDPSQIQPYWTMAQQYALLEHMFTDQASDSFTAHQDIIRGGTIVEPKKAMVDLPGCSGQNCYWGCDAPKVTRTHLVTSANKWVTKGPFPCTTSFKTSYKTLADLMDAASVSWKYYVPAQKTNFGKLMNAFDVIYAVRNGPEWGTNVSWPETNIFNDISASSLPAVSWVIPEENNSDHPGTSQDNGPSWVASIVNAIGGSSYWNSTAIIIVWDDWGGFYDNLAPPAKPYAGLGLRVPAILVSPYARPGYISTTQYQFGSILKYVEGNFGLGSLGTSDQSANSIIDAFNYQQTPIPFQPIQSSHDKAFFLRQTPTSRLDHD